MRLQRINNKKGIVNNFMKKSIEIFSIPN